MQEVEKVWESARKVKKVCQKLRNRAKSWESVRNALIASKVLESACVKSWDSGLIDDNEREIAPISWSLFQDDMPLSKSDVWFQVEGEEESELVDESVQNVDQLFEIIAQDGLRKLEPELDEEEYQEV